MDTNIVTLLVQQMLKNAQPVAENTTLEALRLIIQMINPILAAVIIFIQAKAAASLREVHTAVNSERTASLAEIQRLRVDIAAMVQMKAVEDERKRGVAAAAEIAKAVDIANVKAIT